MIIRKTREINEKRKEKLNKNTCLTTREDEISKRPSYVNLASEYDDLNVVLCGGIREGRR